MDRRPNRISCKARREKSRRALSLLELAVVSAVLGTLTLAAVTRFGTTTIATGTAEGVARKLSLSLVHARRSTIATGDNHYVQLVTSGGNVTSFALFRRTSGGDVQVDQSRLVPQDVTMTSGATTLEFDFEGSALSGYSISISGPDRSWSVSVVTLTGAVRVVETTP